MELELKLARVADEFTSADFQISKDRGGPLFLSSETPTMFILTVHLRGYQKRNIKIEINEDGTRIVISGEKEVRETVIVGWMLHKMDKEVRGFRKAFKIPNGVILDKVRATFDEDESTLTISMPKREKGIRGVSVEEVKEHELTRGGSERLQIDDHEKITNQPRDQEPEDETVSGKEPLENVFQEELQKKSIHDVKRQTEIQERKGKDDRLQMVEEDQERVTENTEGRKGVVSTGKGSTHETADGQEKEDISKGVRGNEQAERATDEDHGEENDIKAMPADKAPMVERERFKICAPVVAGSALLLSIVAFVIHFIRTKSQPGKRKD